MVGHQVERRAAFSGCDTADAVHDPSRRHDALRRGERARGDGNAPSDAIFEARPRRMERSKSDWRARAAVGRRAGTQPSFARVNASKVNRQRQRGSLLDCGLDGSDCDDCRAQGSELFPRHARPR